MSTIRKMTNVAVAMQSAIATALTITSISKATPGIVTVTHSYANGDYVLMQTLGMSQINNRVYRVCNVATTVSFQLEDVTGGTGIDTSAFDAFISGTCQKLTLGNSVTTAAELTLSGGDFDFIDVTTIHVNVKAVIPGAANPIKAEMQLLWDVTDAGQIALKTASDTQAQRTFKITFGTGGPIMIFIGYVGYAAIPVGKALDKITSPCAITAFGMPSYYSA